MERPPECVNTRTSRIVRKADAASLRFRAHSEGLNTDTDILSDNGWDQQAFTIGRINSSVA